MIEKHFIISFNGFATLREPELGFLFSCNCPEEWDRSQRDATGTSLCGKGKRNKNCPKRMAMSPRPDYVEKDQSD